MSRNFDKTQSRPPALKSAVSQLTGPAQIIDGDTINVAGVRVRIHGIDAPELGQTFWYQGRQLECGSMALAALEALTAGIELRFEYIEHDIYRRTVAKCFASNGVDIGRRLVLSGWALAYRRYSMDYVDAENAAREAKRGLWKGKFVKPWHWRAKSANQAARQKRPQKIVPLQSKTLSAKHR